MEEPTALEENVSKVRKVVWKYKDDVKVCGFCDSNFSNDICCSETYHSICEFYRRQDGIIILNKLLLFWGVVWFRLT